MIATFLSHLSRVFGPCLDLDLYAHLYDDVVSFFDKASLYKLLLDNLQASTLHKIS